MSTKLDKILAVILATICWVAALAIIATAKENKDPIGRWIPISYLNFSTSCSVTYGFLGSNKVNLDGGERTLTEDAIRLCPGMDHDSISVRIQDLPGKFINGKLAFIDEEERSKFTTFYLEEMNYRDEIVTVSEYIIELEDEFNKMKLIEY